MPTERWAILNFLRGRAARGYRVWVALGKKGWYIPYSGVIFLSLRETTRRKSRYKPYEAGHSRLYSSCVRSAMRFFRASLRDARAKSTRTAGEMSANAGRNSENSTEHLAAKYNYLEGLYPGHTCTEHRPVSQ